MTHLTSPQLAAASPGTQLWAQRYDGTGKNADAATAVAVRPDGGMVYVTGWSYETNGIRDFATVAYSAGTGARQWVSRYQGPAGSLDTEPAAVAVSPDGTKVFVTGKSLVQGQGQNDYATVAYDAGTGHQLWARDYNGPLNNDDEATAVAVSPDSKTVYITGSSYGTVGAADYATIAYNAVTGDQRWVRRYNGPGNGADNATAIAVSSAGTIYVTGESWGLSPSGYDYATVAYSGTGVQQWVARYAGPGNNTDEATAVAVSPDRNTIYVTGASYGGQATGADYATIAYDTAGKQRWAARYDGPGHYTDQATKVAVSPDSKTVYVTGYSAGSGLNFDYATIAYDTAGHQQWLRRYDDPSHGADRASSMALSPTGATVYVSGTSASSTGIYDYATVAYNAGNGDQRWVQRPAGTISYPSALAVNPKTAAVYVTGQNAQDYITIAYHG